MNKLETLKNILKQSPTAAEITVESCNPDFQVKESGKWLPVSFLEELIKEVEDLEIRCGERESQDYISGFYIGQGT